MKLPKPETIQEIATFLACEFSGNPEHLITGINEIHSVEPGDIVFVDHPKYYKKALQSKATTILIDKKVDCPDGKGLLISAHPFNDFNKLTQHYHPFRPSLKSRGTSSKIDDSAIIYPNVFIGNDVVIGENVVLYPGVCILDRTIIEDNVIIGANTTIGHNAFYYKEKPTGYDRMHTCGNVHIQKNVEIGTLCSIDAGVTATTIIGSGTKIDNQVQIGHDTVIGKNCLFAANVGIAGCVTIEDNVKMWGQVGCASDVVIGKGAIIMAQSGISKDLAGGKTYFGSPAKESRIIYREMAAIRRLPELLENK